MPEIAYEDKKFRNDALYIIAHARRICADYAQQGYDLTLRQLYYQFVSRDLLANRDSEYKRLGSIINDARLSGRLDWDYIVDRTRNLKTNPHWNSPRHILNAVSKQFQFDKWADQDHRIEVWIEKDALTGVLASCCPDEDVPYFSCRGYTSQSEMWGAAQRMLEYIVEGKTVTILHLGDHDPSGLDMTRDIRTRLRNFVGQDYLRHLVQEEELDPKSSDWREEARQAMDRAWNHLFVNRIALNMDQIEQYDPPPNPAKLSDVRARGYIEEHGEYSWELDALEPRVLVQLIRDSIDEYRDYDRWEEAVEREDEEKEMLARVSERWVDVKAFLNGESS